MNVFCGSTPCLNLTNYYKLFENIGLKPFNSIEVEHWFQSVLADHKQPIQENIIVNHHHQSQVKKVLKLKSNDNVLLFENNQNAFFLDFWQEEYKDGCFLLLYNSPEIALAFAIDSGISSVDFINMWMNSARHLLSFQKKNRHKAMLIEADISIAHPDIFLQYLSNKTNLSLNSNNENRFIEAPNYSPLSLWVSKEIIAKQTEILELQSELEASAMPISPRQESINLPVSELEKAYSKIIENIRQSNLTKKELIKSKTNEKLQQNLNKDLEKKTENIQLQLHRVQKELKSHLKNNVEKKKVFELKEELSKINIKLISEQNNREDLEEENELILLQLHQTQEKLENFILENKKLSTSLSSKDVHVTQISNDSLSLAEKKELYKKATNKIVKELFNTAWYQQCGGSKFFSFHHYLIRGWKKKLSPHPLFDPVYYIEANNLFDLKKCPLVHFIAFGSVLEYSPHPLFDSKWYLSNYADVKENGMNPLIHYLKYGVDDERNPSKNFNTCNYLRNNPDVESAGMNPLLHYVLYGQEENRNDW